MFWIHYAMVSYRLLCVGRTGKLTRDNCVLLHLDKLVDRHMEYEVLLCHDKSKVFTAVGPNTVPNNIIGEVPLQFSVHFSHKIKVDHVLNSEKHRIEPKVDSKKVGYQIGVFVQIYLQLFYSFVQGTD